MLKKILYAILVIIITLLMGYELGEGMDREFEYHQRVAAPYRDACNARLEQKAHDEAVRAAREEWHRHNP